MQYDSRWLHRSHTGRLRPHEYTSYLPLFILLLIAGSFLTMYTVYAAHPEPQSGSIGITGIVPGDPPTESAKLTSPSNGSRFNNPLIELRGTCPKNTIVYVYKNDIFGGSIACLDNGTFKTKIDLLVGDNVILLRVFDALDQPGPDSQPITLTYTPTPVQSGTLAPLTFDEQLILNTDAVFKGTFPEQTLTVPLEIIGGTAPYALTIWWGDSETETLVHQSNDTLYLKHAFGRAGTYQLTVQATDPNERTAFLSVATIVNGDPETAITSASVSSSSSIVGQLLALWPLYIGLVMIVLSFWLGERRERKVLETPPVNNLVQN